MKPHLPRLYGTSLSLLRLPSPARVLCLVPLFKAGLLIFALLLPLGCATQQRAGVTPAKMPPFAEQARLNLGAVGLAPDPRPAQFSFEKAKGQIDYAGERAGTRAGNLLATTTPDPLLTAVVGVGTFALAPVTAARGALAARHTLAPEVLSECETNLVKAMTALAGQERFQKFLVEAAADRHWPGLQRVESSPGTQRDGHGMDTLLEARVEDLRLVRTGSGDTSYALEIKARMRLVRATDGAVLYDQPATYRSERGLFMDWTLADVLATVGETGYRELAARMVDQIIAAPAKPLLLGAGYRAQPTRDLQVALRPVKSRSETTERISQVSPVGHSSYALAGARTVSVLSTATLAHVTLRRPLSRQDAGAQAVQDTEFMVENLNTHPNIIVSLTASAVAVPISLWKQSAAVVRGLSPARIRQAEEALSAAAERTQPQDELATELAQRLAPQTAAQVALLKPMIRPSAQHYEDGLRPVPSQPSSAASAVQPVHNSFVGSSGGIVLEIHVQGAALSGGEGINPKLALTVEAQATLLRSRDGRQVYTCSAKYRSQRRTFTEWAAHDAQHFRNELQKCYGTLSAAIVEELVERGVVPPAGRLEAPLLVQSQPSDPKSKVP